MPLCDGPPAFVSAPTFPTVTGLLVIMDEGMPSDLILTHLPLSRCHNTLKYWGLGTILDTTMFWGTRILFSAPVTF